MLWEPGARSAPALSMNEGGCSLGRRWSPLPPNARCSGVAYEHDFRTQLLLPPPGSGGNRGTWRAAAGESKVDSLVGQAITSVLATTHHNTGYPERRPSIGGGPWVSVDILFINGGDRRRAAVAESRISNFAPSPPVSVSPPASDDDQEASSPLLAAAHNTAGVLSFARSRLRRRRRPPSSPLHGCPWPPCLPS